MNNRIMCDIFETRNLDYNLRSQRDFLRTRVNTSSFGLSSLKSLSTKVWVLFVININLFKKKIRNWEHKGCHCRLCKQYLHGVGYVDTF